MKFTASALSCRKITAGEGDLLAFVISEAPRAVPLLPAASREAPCRNPTPPATGISSSSSSSSAVALCDAITCARRAAAALAATFCVLLTPESPDADVERWCAGEIPGDDDPVLLDPPLHCRPYTGLPAPRLSIATSRFIKNVRQEAGPSVERLSGEVGRGNPKKRARLKWEMAKDRERVREREMFSLSLLPPPLVRIRLGE